MTIIITLAAGEQLWKAHPALVSVGVTLTAVPEYDNSLNPVYAAQAQKRPLTLHALRQHTQLLHDHADQLRDQIAAVNKVLQSCKQLAPTHLPLLPLGFQTSPPACWRPTGCCLQLPRTP